MPSGKYLAADEIKQIVKLLASTDLSIAEIGARMSCSRGAVTDVNRRYQIRDYNGRKTAWTTPSTPDVLFSLKTP